MSNRLLPAVFLLFLSFFVIYIIVVTVFRLFFYYSLVSCLYTSSCESSIFLVGAEVGSHILSGNVFEPRALDELFPDWRDMGGPDGGGPPLETKVAEDKFLVLPSETSSLAIPNALLPSELHNEGNYIISLNLLVRWLGQKAEELGVEIYPGFSASEVVYREVGRFGIVYHANKLFVVSLT